MKDILKNIENAATTEQFNDALEAISKIINTASNAQKKAIEDTINRKTDDILTKSKQTRMQAEKVLSEIEAQNISIEVGGRKYPLSEWLTISQYCEKFGLSSTSVVTNWLKRGVITKENTLCIKPLNNLRLIKAIPYNN